MSQKCAEGYCPNCSPDDICTHVREVSEELGNQSMKWKQWAQVKVTKKARNGDFLQKKEWVIEVKHGSFSQFLDELVQSLKTFRGHVYRSIHQYGELRLNRDNLPCNEVILLLDFAENYTVSFEDEIMAYHWSKKQITMHPVHGGISPYTT